MTIFFLNQEVHCKSILKTNINDTVFQCNQIHHKHKLFDKNNQLKITTTKFEWDNI